MVELAATEIVTPPCRLAFPSLFVATPVMNDQNNLAYQAVALIPEDVSLKPFIKCIRAAMKEKFNKEVKIKNPVQSCDDKSYDGYEDGWHFINVKNQYKPGVVDQHSRDIADEDREKIYPGCWVRFHLKAYGWEYASKKGVSFSLQGVQFVRDDDRFDGRANAKDVFDPIEVEDDIDLDDEDVEELFG